jgi:chemotaxis methyl-accepting protein methylase
LDDRLARSKLAFDVASFKALSPDDELLARAGLYFGRGGGPRSRRAILEAASLRRERLDLSPETHLAKLRVDPAEWDALWDLCGPLPGDTFFRFPERFRVMLDLVRERNQTATDKVLRFLSVDSGRGFEPRSLAMVLGRSGLVSDGWRISITALEPSPESARRAEAGVFTREELAWLTPDVVKSWFTIRGGGFSFKAERAPAIEVVKGGLADEALASPNAPKNGFDVIFCGGWNFECPDLHVGRLAEKLFALSAADGLVFSAPGEIWPVDQGRRHEERDGVVYVRGVVAKCTVNVFHQPRRRPLAAWPPASGPAAAGSPKVDSRSRSLAARFEELLPDDPDEAREVVLELLGEDLRRGALDLSNWELMRRTEEAMDRPERAEALRAFIAAMSEN